MKQEIEGRFKYNLERVKSLIEAYAAALPGASGRPRVATTDILRGSVVFLHATIEDLLRSTLAWKLPAASPEQFEDVPLAGQKLRKYTLADIARHRGSTVDDVLERSVMLWLDRSNFNETTEVAGVLAKVSLPAAEAKTILGQYGADLDAMMRRRHWIVHRADRNLARGSGHFAAQSLHPESVRQWLAAVEGFGAAVLALL